jgi:[acyl-carrier-protein] S-malonyltransferase
VYANVSARAQTDPAALKELLSRQMVSPVYWSETIARIWDEGGAHFVECGPKGVLSKMIDPILHNHAPAMAAHSGERPAWKAVSVSDLRSLREFSQEIGAKNDA